MHWFKTAFICTVALGCSAALAAPSAAVGKFRQDVAYKVTDENIDDAADGYTLLEVGADGAIEGGLRVTDAQGRVWRDTCCALRVNESGAVWAAGPAGVAVKQDDGWTTYSGADGVPVTSFTSIAYDAALEEVWFGTKHGAVRYDGNRFHYYQGPRWLPSDDVSETRVFGAGKVLFETGKGFGIIERRPMTLREKANYYEEQIELIKRTPYGYVSAVGIKNPDKSLDELTRDDIRYRSSDNDGLWTSMYGAGECFAYAATGKKIYKKRAKAAFEALRFLQEVTQGGSHPAPEGFVARTILPTDGPDPNEGRIERDRREQEEDDALWKVYEPRWPVSEDGKWYWKSDTSSDELDGHYFFYPIYYDLVAETEKEKARVREVVRKLTDHLIEHGYNLVDHTGSPTRWGIYNPKDLNHNPDWWEERGLKSLSMLSYLTVAHHMTGDEKYLEHREKLILEHGYLTNAMISKQHFGPGSGNQSDDEMAFMCFYNLMKYNDDPQIDNMIGYSFHKHWTLEQPEKNPLFNFMYAPFGQDRHYDDPWGPHQIGIWSGWLDDAVDTLVEFPLDRRNWPHQNSHRADIEMLRRQNAIWPYENHYPVNRGYRKNTEKVISVRNRTFTHWNTDPWDLSYGGNGHSLFSGQVYLLPYYMGLYHGFIEE